MLLIWLGLDFGQYVIPPLTLKGEGVAGVFWDKKIMKKEKRKEGEVQKKEG
jgi:hypothetical protein